MANFPSYYSSGTASIDNAATTVTGTGTTWTAALRAGDLFGIHIGLAVPIASVDSDTQLTLAFAWPGATQSAAAYAVQIIPDVARMQETTRRVLEQISEGNLQALAGLTGAADKLPYFTGAGTMDVADLTEAARLFLGGGYLQVKNGANAYLNVAAVAADYALIEAIKSDGSKGDLRLAEYGGGVFINSFKAWHDGNASFLVNSNGIAAKLPNGFIAQAGFASFTTGGYVNITFPTAFPTAVSDIQTGITANFTSDVLYTAYPAYGLVSTTGAQVYGRKFSGGTVSVISNEGYLYWSASGY